jgi:hypothetical protein
MTPPCAPGRQIRKSGSRAAYLVRAWATAIRDGGQFPDELDASLKNIGELMGAERFEDISARYRDVGKIAEEFPDIQFAPFNRILSKAVHPTAYLVQSQRKEVFGGPMLAAMAICGVAAGLGFYRDLREYIVTLGLPQVPDR